MKPLLRHPGPAAAKLTFDVQDEPQPSEVDVFRWLAQMQADVVESVGGIMLRSARVVPLTVLPTIVSASPGRLVGWSLRIPVFGANPAVVRLRDGDSAAADLISVINLPAASSSNVWLSPGGVSFQNGLFVEVVTGGSLETAVEGTLYLGAAD
jgi:hypothetical protein